MPVGLVDGWDCIGGLAALSIGSDGGRSRNQRWSPKVIGFFFYFFWFEVKGYSIICRPVIRVVVNPESISTQNKDLITG